MADGTPRRRRKLVTSAETLARVDLVLSLLAQAGVPCQGHRLLMALRRAGHTLTEYAIDYAIELAVKEHLVDGRGEVQHRQWAITPKGAARVAHRADEHSNRVCGLASGAIRVCPECDVEHLEGESGPDYRKLRGIADHCARHHAVLSEAPASRPARPGLSEAEQRVLGFLAAHPFRYRLDAKRPDQHKAAHALDARSYAEVISERVDGVLVELVKPTKRGLILAESAGLMCPGRESGECEICCKAIAAMGNEG